MRCGHCDCQESADLRAVFHDISNNLLTFSTLLETVDDNLIPDVNQRHVRMMRTQAARMLTLLKDAVEQDLQPEPVDVRALIGEIVSMADARRLATVTMPPGPQRWLSTRPAALWRAVANVVDNAVRAAGTTGRVEVAVRDESPNVVIEVIDDGPGFGRAPAGTASLGLAIAASLTRQCGGRLDVLTAHPHGVRVRLEFRDLRSGPLSPDLPAPTEQFAGTAGRSRRS